MEKCPCQKELLAFLDQSPTAWHCVRWLEKQLQAAGFERLDERTPWTIEAGGKYFVTRNGSALCAFEVPLERWKECVILGSHTDSPALKLKPEPLLKREGGWLLSSEVYGGPILPSWFNRELGIAGRVVTEREGNVREELVTCMEPLAIIPHVAIHLESELRHTHQVKPQEHLPALTFLGEEELSLEQLLGYEEGAILGADLFLVPTEKSQLTGWKRQLISGYRLDNLLAVHASLRALLEAPPSPSGRMKMLVGWDNEEVGSCTAQGADSSFLKDVMDRLAEGLAHTVSEKIQILQRSFLLSIDAAHALHPNFKEKHEPQHQPRLEGGTVLKLNAQQRYASDALSVAWVRYGAKEKQLPLQQFVIRNDMRGGSTIGPIAASSMGLRTVDLGAPILSMHGARELGAWKDHEEMIQLLSSLLTQDVEPFLSDRIPDRERGSERP